MAKEENVDLNGDTVVPNIALLCMQQMSNDSQWTLNQLIEGYRRSLAHEKATRHLIEIKINDLCSKPWTPSVHSILEALYPDSRRVNDLAEEYLRRNNF